MDALRGITITLVVFEHAIRFTKRTGFEVPYAVDFLSDAFNPVRMPAMAFLAGLLLQASLAKRASTYLGGKVRNILWPFLLWSAIYASMLIVVGGTSGMDHDWSALVEIPTSPPGHMWFLRDLFLFFVLALALRRAPRPPLILLSLALSGVAMSFSEIDTNNQQAPRFFFLFAFFMLGDMAASRAALWPRVLDRRLPAAAAVAVAALMLPVAWTFGNVRYEVLSAPLVVAGIVALMLLSRRLCATRLSAPLRFLGRDSIVIYLLHWLVLAAAVQGIEAVAPRTPGAVVVAAAFALGLGLSALAIPLHRALRLRWLFSLPAPRGRSAAAPAKELAAGSP
jgi:fucose 4-O-acetylase-like acetyltransferase